MIVPAGSVEPEGLSGAVELVIAPRLMCRIYRAELRRLAAYVEAKLALARLLGETKDAN